MFSWSGCAHNQHERKIYGIPYLFFPQSSKDPAYLVSLYVYCPFQCLVSSVYSNRIFLPYIHVQSLADSNIHDYVLQGVTVQGMKNFIPFSAFNCINTPVNSSAFRKWEQKIAICLLTHSPFLILYAFSSLYNLSPVPAHSHSEAIKTAKSNTCPLPSSLTWGGFTMLEAASLINTAQHNAHGM